MSKKKWIPEEASVLFWLITWGLRNKDVYDLAKDILQNRTKDAIIAMTVDVRKFITEAKGGFVEHPANEAQKKLIRLASKIEPIKEIKDLKPESLKEVKFINAGNRSEHPYSANRKFPERDNVGSSIFENIAKHAETQTKEQIIEEDDIAKIRQILELAKEYDTELSVIVVGSIQIRFK